MSSDSDRTIDSDELEQIIARAKEERSSLRFDKKKGNSKNLKRCSVLHDISDSESDDNIKVRKTEKLTTELEDSSEKSRKSSKCDNRPICQYGSKCYRKNPVHKEQFYHPSDKEELSEKSQKSKLFVSNSSQYAHNWKKYQFFLTLVKGISSRYNVDVSYDIKDLLSFEDGTLVASAQFNYMFDIPWLMQQYPDKYRKCPLTIIHGEQKKAKQSLEKWSLKYSNIRFLQAKLDIPFGTHHTKMMFLLYKEGFRVVIHTSNIVESDWAQKTQGMWISPLLPELKSPSAANGESPTNFKSDLLEYVTSYSAPQLDEWTQVIHRHDFSSVKVVLIASVPGRHIGSRKTAFGHLKLRKMLNLNGPSKEIVRDDWCMIGQFSSIGSLGPSSDQWLCTELATSLATCKNTSVSPKSSCLKLIYPSVENVRKSLEGYPAGASLPYSIKIAQKQPYLKSFMHQWKSEKLGRSTASPHIKTYLRLSPDNEKIAWFLLTSANLSKAAWGMLEKKGTQFMIRSYEVGVLYLPEYFGLEVFLSPVKSEENINFFPVPFDIPLQSYLPQDEPWIWDIPHIKAPDRFGNMWCPP